MKGKGQSPESMKMMERRDAPIKSRSERLAGRLEHISPKGFILRTREGEFQYTPSGYGEVERGTKPAIQRVKKRMFIPTLKRPSKGRLTI